MKLLLCSDLAGQVPDIPASVISACDLVLLAGDITVGAKNEARSVKIFEQLGLLFPAPLPVYYIPGNHDHEYLPNPKEWCPPNFQSLHNRITEFQCASYSKPVVIVGFGGAKLGLWNNFAFPEEEIYSSLDSLMAQITMPAVDRFTILLVHDPPADTPLDLTFMKTHVGSKSVRRIIEKWTPDLVVAGHIHESIAVAQLGRTQMVNAGEAKQNHYALITVDSTDISIQLF